MSSSAATPAAWAGRLTLNGPRSAVDHVDDAGRRRHPAEPQAGEAVELGEGAGHDDVLGLVDQFDARFVVVAADILGIGRVDHQQHVLRQAGVQAPHLVR